MTARIIFVHAGNDAKGSPTKLELLIHLDAGRVLYKTFENQQVAIKVTWPNAKPIHQAGRAKARSALTFTLGLIINIHIKVWQFIWMRIIIDEWQKQNSSGMQRKMH